MPLAVIDATGSGPVTYYVHADHLNRPIAMTDAAKTFVARFTWTPYGELSAYAGTKDIDLRFPGQLYEAESGLAYNWHRQYDATTGRYTQPDPLGLIDGPSRFAYVGNDPLQKMDPTGRQMSIPKSLPLPPLPVPDGEALRGLADNLGLAICAMNPALSLWVLNNARPDQADKKQCYKDFERNQDKCYKNYGYNARDLSGCLERAEIVRDLCLRGQENMSPWSDKDVDGWAPPKPPKNRR